MIRKLSVAFATLAVLASLNGCAKTPTPQDTAADKAKLESDALTWFDAFARGDSDSVANLYAEDAVLMPPNMPAVSGRAAIKTVLSQMIAEAHAGKMSMKNTNTTGSDVSGDMGWISGAFSIADSTGATIDSGKYVTVHHRVNGSWLYVRDIWNSDRPAAPTAPAKHKK